MRYFFLFVYMVSIVFASFIDKIHTYDNHLAGCVVIDTKIHHQIHCAVNKPRVQDITMQQYKRRWPNS